TRTGQLLGTPNYMAPEQAEGRTRGLTTAADVYGLGAILYECLAGKPPFDGDGWMDTVHQVILRDAVPPSRLRPSVPRDLEPICLKCLQKEPPKRYASAADLADDLQRYLDGEPIRARRVGPLERAWKWARRRPGWAAVIGGSALAVLLSFALVV